MATRTVVGLLKTPDGEPWVGATIQFRLIPGSYTATDQYVPAVVETTTGALGAISVDLWTNEDGERSSKYRCTLPPTTTPEGGTIPGEVFEFTLPTGGTDIELSVLRLAGVVTPDPQYDTLVTWILAQWKGAWDNATAYGKGDKVSHEGSSYIATADTTAGQEPGVHASWSIMATGLDVAAPETVSGQWTFSHSSGLLTNTVTERTAGSGVTIDGLLVKDGGIPEAAVTAHQAALTIAESQITDGSILARVAGTETITGLYTFAHASGLLTDVIGERTATAGVTVDGLLIKDGGIPQAAVTAHQAALSIAASQVTAATFGAGTYSFLGSTITDLGTVQGATSITASSFVGPLTGNASTATKLATARAINGVDFDGSAAITVTAAAGTLSGNTLASNVLASSLTSLGTIASLVATTADINGGTIDGATIGVTSHSTGKFTTLEATTSLTLPLVILSSTAPSVRWHDTNGTADVRRIRATLDGDLWNLTQYRDNESSYYTLLEFASGRTGYFPWPVSIGSAAAGAQALVSATPRLTVAGATTSASGSATHLSVAGSLTAAANSAVLYGARISSMYANGGFASTVAYGLRIEDVTGAATNYALSTGAGLVNFGGAVTGASFSGPLNGTVGATTPAAGAFTTLSASTSVGVAATAKVYLDGVAQNGNTYIHESSADTVQIVAGGAAFTVAYVSAGIASATFTGTAILPAATTSLSPLRIPHGTAHSSPTNGDIWTTTAGVFARINGATYSLDMTAV